MSNAIDLKQVQAVRTMQANSVYNAAFQIYLSRINNEQWKDWPPKVIAKSSIDAAKIFHQTVQEDMQDGSS